MQIGRPTVDPTAIARFEKIHGGGGGEGGGDISMGRTPPTRGFLLRCNRVYGGGPSSRNRAVNI